MATFDYDDLFANRRVIVFSITNFRTLDSADQLHAFAKNYNWFKSNGIDDVYCVDSTDPMMAPWADKKTKDIKALPDRDMEFVRIVANNFDYNKKIFDLARYWQYVVVINNGMPEKLWHSEFDETLPLAVLKSKESRYKNLSIDTIQEYLLDINT